MVSYFIARVLRRGLTPDEAFDRCAGPLDAGGETVKAPSARWQQLEQPVHSASHEAATQERQQVPAIRQLRWPARAVADKRDRAHASQR